MVGVERPIKALSMHIQKSYKVERPIKALSMHIQKSYKVIIVSVLIAVIFSIFFFQPDSFMHMFNVSILYRKSIKLLH